ncbi:MAG: putative NADH-dependent oxidoreductase-possiblyglucose-fructose dependent oxidoreductase [uncultured Propionibacteriaceae bacterium]|uniref:Putative NADH-dependent oxidoreductase-possiblyglucose-fructose dependent oxidoreductase n=1 Tax=uncultured Propionibacteriaceae bacterium TaxID=257457 RepID=A0A6J4NGK4_9ACTN|nr:MAG: putative NADH-dependent oxidoreductase-possiblyglucose-fructose dependent oxidoreductase [uncultured Propionibacteriaceae bacterium]
MSATGISVAVVGLGFGQDFVPIYLAHPDVARVVLVDPDTARLSEVGQRFGISELYPDVAGVLADPTIDAVHVLAPVHLHAELSVATLNAGKHCACAVPMATSLEDIDKIIATQAVTGKNYMMMETAVYGREYLTVEELYRQGEIGTLTLYRGFHIQNLDGYPSYWQGYPPMHYATHALAPALALLDTTAASVQCQGAGRLTPDRTAGNYANPFPTEVGFFRLAGSDALADITMSFFQTARSYLEGFSLYGEHIGIEWPPDNEGELLRFDMSAPAAGIRGNTVKSTTMPARDFPERLPSDLRKFTKAGTVQLPGMPAPARISAHHGGSHPHLVAEFVASIRDGRAPRIDDKRAAEWTAPGICAHESALTGGRTVTIPNYS